MKKTVVFLSAVAAALSSCQSASKSNVRADAETIEEARRSCESGNSFSCFRAGILESDPDAQEKFLGKACDSYTLPVACQYAGGVARERKRFKEAFSYNEKGC